MQALVIALVVVAALALVIVAKRWRPARARAREAQADLALVRQMLAEDVEALGDDLARFGAEQPALLDDETLTDLSTARASQASALTALPGLHSAQDLEDEVEALNDGRFALARARARVEGRRLPTRRTPCFFNPQHGPADDDILWNQPGRGTRRVPACEADVARQAAGERLEARRVHLGGVTVPYWEAGAALAPYVRGNFIGKGTSSDIRLDATAVFVAPFDVPLPNADDQFRKWSP